MVLQQDLSSLPNKEYFTISEVAEFFNLKPYVLRYWEQQFKKLNPIKRNKRRYYQKRDVQFILRLKDLLHTQGYSIQGVKDMLEEESSGDFTPPLSPMKSLVYPKIQSINIKIDGLIQLVNKMK